MVWIGNVLSFLKKFYRQWQVKNILTRVVKVGVVKVGLRGSVYVSNHCVNHEKGDSLEIYRSFGLLLIIRKKSS